MELNALLKGINFILKWQARVIHVDTDSLFMYHWITNGFTGMSQLNTKATNAHRDENTHKVGHTVLTDTGIQFSVSAALELNQN